MDPELQRVIRPARDGGLMDGEPSPRREWLVVNGLGGYASGTVAGVVTRRYHGLLVASLPAPLGRIVMLNHLLERVRLPSRGVLWLGDEDEVAGPNAADRADHLVEFRLELGLPVWRYEIDGYAIEKRVVMPHGLNTVHLTYTLLQGEGPVRLTLRPSVQFRGYEAAVDESPVQSYSLTAIRRRYELSGGGAFPCLRLAMHGQYAALTLDEKGVPTVVDRAFVVPPVGHIGPITPEQRQQLIATSLVAGVYENAIDRESAYEMLQVKAQAKLAEQQQTAEAAAMAKVAEEQAKAEAREARAGGGRDSVVESFAKSAARSVGTNIGRQIVRGVLGSLFGGKKSWF